MEKGYGYVKAGVILSDFYDIGTFQSRLFDEVTMRSNSHLLMSTLDNINPAVLAGVFAKQGMHRDWAMGGNFLAAC